MYSVANVLDPSKYSLGSTSNCVIPLASAEAGYLNQVEMSESSSLVKETSKSLHAVVAKSATRALPLESSSPGREKSKTVSARVESVAKRRSS